MERIARQKPTSIARLLYYTVTSLELACERFRNAATLEDKRNANQEMFATLVRAGICPTRTENRTSIAIEIEEPDQRERFAVRAQLEIDHWTLQTRGGGLQYDGDDRNDGPAPELTETAASQIRLRTLKALKFLYNTGMGCTECRHAVDGSQGWMRTASRLQVALRTIEKHTMSWKGEPSIRELAKELDSLGAQLRFKHHPLSAGRKLKELLLSVSGGENSPSLTPAPANSDAGAADSTANATVTVTTALQSKPNAKSNGIAEIAFRLLQRPPNGRPIIDHRSAETIMKQLSMKQGWAKIAYRADDWDTIAKLPHDDDGENEKAVSTETSAPANA